MTPPPLERRNVLPFRPRDRKPRYRRRHPLAKLLLPFFGAVTVVGVPLWTASWLLVTPRLALAEVKVEPDPALVTPDGARALRRVPESWVLRALEPLAGRNLLRLPLDAAQARIVSHPWAREVRLRKEPPHRLRVQVLEHRPAALLHEGEALVYVDDRGRAIAPYTAEDGEVDLLVISRPPASAAAPDAVPAPVQTPEPAAGEAAVEIEPAVVAVAGDDGRDAELVAALAVARELAAAQEIWFAGLSEVAILGARDFRLITGELPFPLLVHAGTLTRRVRPLEALIPQILARYGTVAAVDLRFARRIIVQPFARPSGMES